MLSFNPPLTKEDFLNSHWQDVINSSEKKECRAYYRAFWEKAQEAKEAGKVKEQAVFEILAFVTDKVIKPESTEEFFLEKFQNLTDEHLEFFKEIAPEISDPELQARVADILWCRRYPQNGYYKMAQLAVDAYLQSAIELEDLEHWTWCFDRIERAFRLAHKVKYQPEKVIEYIETVLNRYKAQAYITPAIYQINLEHSVSIKDLLPIVSHNLFIPPGREYLFAKGLYAGLTGDFMTSIHILIPQIENSVRYLLSQRGVITSSLDDQGIQNEHNLNTTLYCPEITSIFDEDTLFDLKGLLVERAGSNLRNRMAHGLMNDDQFSSPLMIYLWWLTLRICCLPILNYQKQVQESDPWVKFSGMFKDDPLFDEFVEDMAAYRDELDEVNSEETQSA
jgi:hypothetical protein